MWRIYAAIILTIVVLIASMSVFLMLISDPFFDTVMSRAEVVRSILRTAAGQDIADASTAVFFVDSFDQAATIADLEYVGVHSIFITIDGEVLVKHPNPLVDGEVSLYAEECRQPRSDSELSCLTATISRYHSVQQSALVSTSPVELFPGYPWDIRTDIGSADLKNGDVGAAVQELQVFLNRNGFSVASDGRPGSSERETNHFGPDTEDALRRFQRQHELPESGEFDAVTRNVVSRYRSPR